MLGIWNKLKKAASFNAGPSDPSTHLPPRVPRKSDSRSPPFQSPSSTAASSRSSSSRFSGGRSSRKHCAICLGNVKNGQGQAIFTAECSHSFHFKCIAKNVKHGNQLCPICRCKWTELPFQMPTPNYPRRDNPPPPITPQPTTLFSEPSRFCDDEPLLFVSTDPPGGTAASFAPSNNVSVKTVPEFPAVASRSSVSNFAVLVGVRGPALLDDARRVERAPVDLVTVLDESGSMAGEKLDLVKRAVRFVIDNLGPVDRLSIVSFSCTARRIFPLRRMTDGGREDARLAVESLAAGGGTDIVQGLRKGTRVLEERREKNPFASIILLSDGRDNRNSSDTAGALEYLNLLPSSIFMNNETEYVGLGRTTFPVHTFGFGSDHDPFSLHVISDLSGGTFSSIESVAMVQDAFARCIGGLLSVVAHELKLTLTSSMSPGVEIQSIPSGIYSREISGDRKKATITIGELYADEEKEFLVHLSVPVGSQNTSLLRIFCSYMDYTRGLVRLEESRVDIRRPEILSPTDSTVNLEVDRQKVRLSVIETIKEARLMAESGNLEGAQAMLSNGRWALLSSASARAGDGLCVHLEAELMEIRDRMGTTEIYESTGRSYLLSELSSHSSQRSTTRGESGSSTHSGVVGNGYDTPTMVTMVLRSQDLSGLYAREEDGPRLTRSASLNSAASV